MIKKITFVLFLFMGSFGLLKAQDTIPAVTEETPVVEEDKPVRDPWACTMLIDAQTTLPVPKGQLEFIIHHRMSDMSTGLTDLYGIYGSANIRLGFNYGITNKLMLGIGTEKNNKYHELMLKYNMIQQSRSGKIPVSVTFIENIAINGKDYTDYGQKFSGFGQRFSYFHQLMVSRKFGDRLSAEVGGNYIHFNGVDSTHTNDYLGVTAGGRFKFYNEMAFIFEYNQAFCVGTEIKNYVDEPKPSVAFGLEIATSTHAFQIFCSQFSHISPQKNFAYQDSDFEFKKMGIGFNVTVRF